MPTLIRSLPGAILVATLLLAGWLIIGTRPPLLGLGLALSAGAPLAYMVRHWNNRGNVREHPVAISALAGLGCVMIMVAVQRFGDQHQWILLPALANLAAWMAWQRWVLRKPPARKISG